MLEKGKQIEYNQEETSLFSEQNEFSWKDRKMKTRETLCVLYKLSCDSLPTFENPSWISKHVLPNIFPCIELHFFLQINNLNFS